MWSDRKCGLQVAGLEAGEHPWRFKPLYCALHPIIVEKNCVKLADEYEIYQQGTCQRTVCEVPIPLYQLFDSEMKYALGEEGYAELKSHVQGT